MVATVYVDGLIAGFVWGKDRLDTHSKVRKYFPDASSMNNRDVHPDVKDDRFYKVNENFALWNNLVWESASQCL